MTLSPASVWILDKYRQLEEDLQQNLQTYELSHNIESLYHFLWSDFADWYVEYLKTDVSQKPFAKELFKQFIVTLSPYVPFETEVLWQKFFQERESLAMTVKDKQWLNSKLEEVDVTQAQEFQKIIDFIGHVRSLRGVFAIDPAKPLTVYTQYEPLFKYQEFVQLVAKTQLSNEVRKNLYQVHLEEYSFAVDILNLIEDPQAEIKRTRKNLQSLEKQIASLQKQLGNDSFRAKAPTEVIEQKETDLAARRQEQSDEQTKLDFLEKYWEKG